MKKKAILVALLASVATAALADGLWLHQYPGYVKDGAVDLKTKSGGTISYERNDTGNAVNKIRARDVRVIMTNKVTQDPWSLKWRDNVKR